MNSSLPQLKTVSLQMQAPHQALALSRLDLHHTQQSQPLTLVPVYCLPFSCGKDFASCFLLFPGGALCPEVPHPKPAALHWPVLQLW